MNADFPAAHSMDTDWFAIDQNGCVALFISGAGGAVPRDAYCGDDFSAGDQVLAQIRGDGKEIDYRDLRKVAAQLGVFVYETGPNDEALVDRYHRSRPPRRLLHVDQLPPELREAIAEMRFETLDFAKTKVVQPIELTECGTWDPAYLAGDGKTVKPVPGREKEYAEFLEEAREFFDEDGLTVEEPPPKKRKPRGKKT
jgi:hypothetical protein